MPVPQCIVKMKKALLVIAFTILIAALGLRGYFVLIPPPESTLDEQLDDIFPQEITGWKVRDLSISNSPESTARVSEFLNFDDSLFRIYQKGHISVSLYIAYWTPGKASYRWAGAHTPDTCWVLNGWTRLDRQYGIPFVSGSTEFQPAEFGVFKNGETEQNVYFWHLVGGSVFGYKQKGSPNIFGALIDIKTHGLNLRKEQFFIRISSNRTIDELNKIEGFQSILDGLVTIGLQKRANGPLGD